MNDDEVLYIHIRSSLGIKYNLQLTNGTGIIAVSYTHLMCIRDRAKSA